VRIKFEENVRIRMEGNNVGREKLRDNIVDAGTQFLGKRQEGLTEE